MRALLLTAIIVLAACSGRPERPEETTPAPAAAGERLTVREAAVADFKPVAATVATRDMGEARTRIGGALASLAVREGDVVRKGQLIAVVTDQRLTFETRAYDAQASAAAAEAARAAEDFKRVQTLYDKGIYAKARLEQAQAAARAAEANLAAAREQRAAAAELGAQGAVLAPSDGRVLHADVPVGSVVSPGQSIATITAGPPLLRLEIPEAQGRALRAGQRVAIDQDDLPGAAEGVIAQVYPAVTAGRVTADVAVQGLRADLVGRRVRVKVKVGERRAIVVPERFVATRYGVDFVRLIGEDGKVQEAAVQIAPLPGDGQVEVLSGLSAGDVIAARSGR